ncbi:type III-B CRISPR module RAMP protein Cmr6 [Thermodesulfitimonas autotrophica]|nr:type III-B CRISPR module RAMP protein Cmr6 [Thermodesulfitimonas autotrophica]
MLNQAIHRTATLVLALGGEIRCLTTDWRFVTGLGREHPVENGFAWHHTLGVPFLPGSSVKGIVRAWAETWIDPPVSDDVRRIFGPDGEVRDKHVGSVIFFDALPVKPVRLEADVMTPHYALYYQQDRPENPPGDWYDPVPIPFLTVAPSQVFLFALAPRRLDDEQGRADCQRAMEWLTEALAAVGAGAKTAVGYGRFVRQEKEESEIRRGLTAYDVTFTPAADKLSGVPSGKHVPPAAMSPLRAEMEEDGYNRDPDRFMSALTTKWLKKLQDDQTIPDEKREIAVLLKEWYLMYRGEQWRRPNKKNKAKIAEIKKVLGE